MTSAIEALEPLRETIRRYDLTARKSLGQNFLLDLNLTRRIARAAGDLSSGTTIEIGPGPGGLTRALLLEGATNVVAVERDPRAVAALSELVEASAGRLHIVEADALKLDPTSLGPAPRRIVANLPYNIATRLLLGWLEQPDAFDSLTLMFQKEVAERLVAAPGTSQYGRPSIVVQWLAEARLLFEVPARAFTPPPKVTSAIVHLEPRATPLFPANRRQLEQLTQAAFGQRRKMLRSSLKKLGGESMLRGAGIEPTARPEELSIEEFCRLARAI